MNFSSRLLNVILEVSKIYIFSSFSFKSFSASVLLGITIVGFRVSLVCLDPVQILVCQELIVIPIVKETIVI